MPTPTLIQPSEVINDGIFRVSPVTTNFDQNLVNNTLIASAEEDNTIHLLGLELYEDMVAQQNTIPSNYNPDAGPIVQKFPTNAAYETLWTKFLLRYEGWIVYKDIIDFITIQASSQGLLYTKTEYADNAGIEGADRIIQTVQKKIDNLVDRIKNFICDNKSDYPLYPSENRCKCDQNEDAQEKFYDKWHGSHCGDCHDGYDCGCGYYNSGYYSYYKKKNIKRDSSTGIMFY